MNLNFADLFNNKLEQDEPIDRSAEEERDDYQRDETDEHYLSEYRGNEAKPVELPQEAELEDDRFSHKGHFYDQTHDRFTRGSDNN